MQDISYTSFTSSTFSSLGVPLTPPLGGCDPFVVGGGVGMLACVPEVEEGDEEGCVDVSVASCGVVDRDKALPAPPVDRDEDTQRSSDTRSDVNSIMNAHESLICELRQNNNAREDDGVAQPEVESVFGSARSRSRSSSIDSVISTMSMVSHCRIHDSTDVEDTPTTAVAVTGAEEEDEKASVAKSRVRREDVWREVLKTAVGRDKAFVRHACFRECASESRACQAD